MKTTDTIVIGGGQAGLAMSRCLADASVDHVVLERGRLAERWRSERWDSLRLLTPRWQSRLPGYAYRGDDPDGYMSSAELIDYLEGYASSFAAPVETETTVLSVRRTGGTYRVATDQGELRARAVVVATGHCDVPLVPAIGRALPQRIQQVVPTRYRRPDAVAPGGVLVVGASATGAQLADELARAGRRVFLAVGKHTRLPRSYRGRDIVWWLDAMGIFDQRAEEVASLAASRRQPSLQLVGRPDRRDVDLAALSRVGVTLLGRMTGADGERASFAPSLDTAVRDAERKMHGLLDRIDAFADRRELAEPGVAPARPSPIRVAPSPTAIDLRAQGIGTVLWATGFRRRYPWLEVPVLDAAGDIRQRGGITPAPGLYTLGLFFQQRRKSSFIDGVGDDARELTHHLLSHLSHRRAA